MGIVHGLSINQGKLDVQFADSDFYKEKDNSIKINPVVFEEPLKQVPIGTALKRDATTGEISLAIGADMVNHGPLDFDDERKLIFKYGDGLKTDADTHALKVDRDALATFISEEIAKLLANADENYDTLQEIAAYISSDATNAAQITNDINDLKANKQDTISLGSGLLFDTDGNLSVLTGKGFEIDPVTNEINLRVGSGVRITDDNLRVEADDLRGEGLIVQYNQLYVNYCDVAQRLGGDGLVVSDNQLNIGYCDVAKTLAGCGLVQSNTTLNIDYANIIGDGLDHNNSRIKVCLASNYYTQAGYNEGTPLFFNDRNGICLRIAEGLMVKQNTLNVNVDNLVYDGLVANNGRLGVDYNNLTATMAGEGLWYDGSKLKFAIGSGLVYEPIDTTIRLASGDVKLINEATDDRSTESISAIIDFDSSTGILFKLSTGLAVDDNGYLYVDVEKIAQLANSTQTTNEA